MNNIRNRDIFGIVGTLFFAMLLLIAFINPPSKSHYNPANDSRSKVECNNSQSPPDTRKTAEKNVCTERSALAAQWKATDVTNWAFWAGLLGIWFVGWTLFSTMKATEESRKSNIAELRAYLTFNRMQGVVYPGGSRATNSILMFWFSNTGVTPARNIRAYTEMFAMEGEYMSSRIEPKLIENGIAQKFTKQGLTTTHIPKDGEGRIEIYHPPIPEAFVDRFNRRNINFVFKISVYYCDTFGIERINTFWAGQCADRGWYDYKTEEE